MAGAFGEPTITLEAKAWLTSRLLNGRRPGAAVGALEKCGAQFVFEITPAAAKC